MAKNCLQAEAVRAQVVLQLCDAVFHVGAPVVIAPDLLRCVAATGDEDAEGVTRHVDQLATHAIAAFAHLFANNDEAPRDAPTVQLQLKLAHSVVVVQRRPLLHPLGGALHPRGELGHYNIGQQALFQKAQQLVVEEA